MSLLLKCADECDIHEQIVLEDPVRVYSKEHYAVYSFKKGVTSIILGSTVIRYMRENRDGSGKSPFKYSNFNGDKSKPAFYLYRYFEDIESHVYNNLGSIYYGATAGTIVNYKLTNCVTIDTDNLKVDNCSCISNVSLRKISGYDTYFLTINDWCFSIGFTSFEGKPLVVDNLEDKTIGRIAIFGMSREWNSDKRKRYVIDFNVGGHKLREDTYHNIEFRNVVQKDNILSFDLLIVSDVVMDWYINSADRVNIDLETGEVFIVVRNQRQVIHRGIDMSDIARNLVFNMKV